MTQLESNKAIICELTFTEAGELYRFDFSHPLFSGRQSSIRSRWIFASGTAGTFQWTSAVKGLCLLILKAKIREQAFIEGEGRSLAASLDYAISKRPEWLKSFFGADSKGNILSDRVFLRENPERKRGGPVKIRLSNFLNTSCIRIRVSRRDISNDINQLHSLEQKLSGVPQAMEEKIEWSKILKTSHIISVREALSDILSFNNRSFVDRISKLESSSYIKRYFGGTIGKLLGSLVRNQSDTNLRLGILDYGSLRARLAHKPLKVSCPVSVPESLLLFVYLRDIVKLPIQIDSDHAYAIPLARKVVDKDLESLPDAVVLGFVPSLRYLGRGTFADYRASFALPRARHFILSGSSSKKHVRNRSGNLLLICSEPSTTEFFGWSASRGEAAGSKNINFIHREPDELAFDYASDNPDTPPAVAMSIFAHINRSIFGKEIVEQKDNIASEQHSILYLHKSMDSLTKELFLAALRDAWLKLRSDETLRSDLIEKLTSNEEYSNYVARVSGAVYSPKWT